VRSIHQTVAVVIDGERDGTFDAANEVSWEVLARIAKDCKVTRGEAERIANELGLHAEHLVDTANILKLRQAVAAHVLERAPRKPSGSGQSSDE